MTNAYNYDSYSSDPSLPFPDQHASSGNEKYFQLRRQLFYLWTYMIQQEIWEEAIEVLDEHRDGPTPFDLFSFEDPGHPGCMF